MSTIKDSKLAKIGHEEVSWASRQDASSRGNKK